MSQSNNQHIENFIKDFGKLIKKLRQEEKPNKQETLSEEIGISTRQLSDIENGKTICRLDTIYKICDAFDLSIADFFSRLEDLD